MNDATNIIKKSPLAPTVLITGGGGFIGSHLVEALLLKDVKVVVIDNLSTGNKANFGTVLDNPKFTFIEADINEGIPKNIEGVDYIFHLAGSQAHEYQNDNVSLDVLLTNAVGTKHLLDLAKRSLAKFLLVSSLDVYEGFVSSNDLNTYFGLTPNQERKYSFSEAKRYAEAIVWEYHKKHKVNARVIRLPEVYGPRMSFDSSGELGRLLKLLLDHRDLTVFGDGLDKNYYLHIIDVISALVKAQFSDDTDGKIYSLIDGDQITTLELTYLIKSLANHEIQVLFKNVVQPLSHKDLKNIDTNNLRDLKWNARLSLKEGLTKTLKWYGYEFNTNSFKPIIYAQKKEEVAPIDSSHVTSLKPEPLPMPPPPISKPKAPIVQSTSSLPLIGSIVALGMSLFFFAVLPLMLLLFYTNKGYSHLNQAQELFEKLNLDDANLKGGEAVASFNKAESQLKNLGWVFLISGQEKRLRTYGKLLKIAEYSSSAITNTSLGTKPLKELWESAKPTSQLTVDKTTISQAALNFKSAKEDLARAEAEIKDVNLSLLPGPLRKNLETLNLKIPQAKELLDMADIVIQSLPALMGVDSRKQYLILFQNPTELRSTGGFIGSYAVASFENGKIKEVTIDDVYNVDGLLDLNGIKTPAYVPIQKNLRQDYLRIRDANWQPSFPDSAYTILGLFQQANGVKFDGVVAIDMYLIKDILKSTGPIYLTAYNEEITSDNVYERSQYHSEAQYQEGSQQKKAFLTVLGGKLLETIFSLPNEKTSSLSKEVFLDLDKRHILLYVPNSPVSSLISKQGWDGAVGDVGSDYVYIVDNNLGANKANYFIKQDAKYEVKNSYRDGAIEVELTINYNHTQKDSTWPGGPYKDYLRVLVPKESFLHKVTAGETDITKQVVVGEEAGRRTFEVEFILDPSRTLQLKFNYTLPSTISLGKGERVYSLYWQKQPGTDAMPVTVVFDKPFGKEVTSTTPPFTKNKENFEVKSSLSTDLKFLINVK